jgi:hypothetical protein
MSKPILCLDFDGVIHSYTSGWQGADIVADPPTSGAIEFLWRAIERFDVQILSSRSGQPGGIEAMQGWLSRWDAAYWADEPARPRTCLVLCIKFPTAKPAAFLTIDDRALTFTGTFPDVTTLGDFKPWNKKDPS